MSVTDFTHRDPTFGHDPWNGPGKPVDTIETFTASASAQKIYTGADTLAGDIQLLPTGLDAYMSYVDNFGGWGELVARFGHTGALLVSITIFGNPARCADVEPGAMHESSLPHWLDHVALRDGGQVPWVYCSASNMAACNAQIGSRKVIRWSAHFGSGPHICGPRTCGFPQADWTQWDDHGAHGENLDRSIGTVLPVPVPPDPNHYAWYDTAHRVVYGGRTELSVVQEYDAKRALQTSTSHPSAAKLALLRSYCGGGAARLWTVAHTPGLGGWGPNHRGWRWQQLRHRFKGERVA